MQLQGAWAFSNTQPASALGMEVVSVIPIRATVQLLGRIFMIALIAIAFDQTKTAEQVCCVSS